MGRVLNVQERVTQQIAVPGHEAGRQRLLLKKTAGIPKLISADIGQRVVRTVAIRLANRRRKPRPRIGTALKARWVIDLTMGWHFSSHLGLTGVQ